MLTEHYEHIDSGNRNLTNTNRPVYPSRANFKIELDSTVRDIHSVELLGLVLPNLDNILDEPYLILQIDELNGIYAGNPRIPCTAVVHLQNPIAGQNYTHVAACKKVAERSPIFYRPPKAKIDALTIKILKSDGTLVNLGTDVSTPLRQNQVSLHLKFTIDSKDPTSVTKEYRLP